MQLYTLSELDATEDDLCGHVVYAICDDAGALLYVGKTTNIQGRLGEHRRSSSSLGRALRVAGERSRDWTITVYQLADCADAVHRHRPAERAWYAQNVAEGRALDSCLRSAEQSLIADLRPALNGQWW